MDPSALRPRVVAELIGTAFLVAAVVGSGIMAERLSDDVGLQLLQNAFATAGVLAALIFAFGALSGAHFNPVVTLVARLDGEIDTRIAIWYVVAQVTGAIVGVVSANVMFELPAVAASTTVRASPALWFAEVVATFGLVLLIVATVRSGRGEMVAVVVAGYIAGAYYFTSSTSFANPAVTIGRSLTDTFAGIAPSSVPAFIVAQLLGGAAAALVTSAMWPR